MNLSKKSKLLMTFFTKNECINHSKQTDKTKQILLELHGDILEAHEYIYSLKIIRV